MKKAYFAAAALASALALPGAPASAQTNEIVIGISLTTTGPGAPLGIPERKLRVVAPDVGGGFGSKQVVYAEEALVTWAARKLEQPVKWVADRSEAFIPDAQGRDHITHAELAFDTHGKFLGLRVSTLANIGGYWDRLLAVIE